MWRLGNEVFAEVAIPEVPGSRLSSSEFIPVLVDAALHADGSYRRPVRDNVYRILARVCKHAAGASRARVAGIAPVGEVRSR